MTLWACTFQNSKSVAWDILVEPWGEQHTLRPDESLRIVFFGSHTGEPEILAGDENLKIYGWQGSRLYVLRDNVCVLQPSIQEIVHRLAPKHSVDLSELQILHDSERMEAAQFALDAAPAWNQTGAAAALDAIFLVVPSLAPLNSDELIWDICQEILMSRGVFLRPDSRLQAEFFKRLRQEPGDFLELLLNWNEAENVVTDSSAAQPLTPR